VLGALPVVSGLTTQVSSLLSGLTSGLLSTPAGQASSSTPADSAGLLDGLLGNACDPTSGAAARVAP
jgi:hypothetical protein